MANYRNISMAFWTDPKVVDDFTPEDRYIYLYCMTNPHSNLCGCYELSIKQISTETGYTADVVEHLLDRLDNDHDVIRYSVSTKELLILNWYRYNWSASDKLNKPLLEEIQKVKNARFREYLADRYNERETVKVPYDSKSGEEIPSEAEVRHKYGEYGWVKLTDAEYERLQKGLGDVELKRCITYVDESAQATGNKNKWKDWNLVIRKCHRQQWGVSRSGKGNPQPTTTKKSSYDLKNIEQKVNQFE